MIYNLKRVTGVYVKGFYKYLTDRKLENENREEIYDLFSFAIKNIYGLPSSERNYFIDVYGGDCISYLMKLKGVPKKISKLDINDRLAIVTMCKNYYVAVGLLSDKKKSI